VACEQRRLRYRRRFDQLPVEHEPREVAVERRALVEFTGRCLPGIGRAPARLGDEHRVDGAFVRWVQRHVRRHKAFVLSFKRGSLAELRGTGVHVLCVCPGFTRTEFQEKAASTRAPCGILLDERREVADQAVGALGRIPCS